MTYAKWIFWALLIAVVAGFFHFVLPQHDVVRIVDTQIARMDVTERSAPADGTGPAGVRTRDVRLIYAKFPDGDDMVYRNEDTGWGFPFYFKFDSDNLMARASDLTSTAAEPRWVVVTHYGWRVPMFSMYPNALKIRLAEGPDEDVFPWFTAIFIAFVVIGILVLRRIFIILRRRHVDPVVRQIDRQSDRGTTWWGRRWRALRRGR